MTLQVPKPHLTLLVCIWATTVAIAQQDPAPPPANGIIIGTVLDVNGGTVPGASVSLKGPIAGEDRRLLTQDNGFFKLDAVKPGIPYHVTVAAKGFANWASSKIVLQPGQFFILPRITLRVATAQVTVNVVPAEQVAIQQVKAAEQQRVLGFIPNFYVSYEPNPVPLTPKLKFRLALKSLVDPVTLAGFGFNAAIYQMSDYPSGYDQGAKGYGQRLGATFAGGWTNVIVGDALLPSLLHHDPRYFYKGTGTKKSRLFHALGSSFVSKGDDGRQHINFSSIGGDLASGAIANAYYPAEERGMGLVVSSALIGAAGRMAEGVFQEFVLHKITSRHAAKHSSSSTTVAYQH